MSATTKDPERRFPTKCSTSLILHGLDLSQKTILITGTTAGIGKATAEALANAGAHIIMANRNVTLSEQVKQKIVAKNVNARVDIIQCDFSSLKSIKQAADCLRQSGQSLDVVILNAGLMYSPEQTTKDGFETTFGVNCLGRFYMTKLLVPKLLKDDCRIVIVSSDLHDQPPVKQIMTLEEKMQTLIPQASSPLVSGGVADKVQLYDVSTLCNNLFAFRLADRLKHFRPSVTVSALNPGGSNTSITRSSTFLKLYAFVMHPFHRSADQGAATTVYCAVAPELKGVTGRYYEDTYFAKPERLESLCKDVDLQEALWERSEEFISHFETANNLPASSWEY